jgi:hypothetical protein
MNPPLSYTPTLAFKALSALPSEVAPDGRILLDVLISEEVSLLPYGNQLNHARVTIKDFHDRFRTRSINITPIFPGEGAVGAWKQFYEETLQRVHAFGKAIQEEADIVQRCEESLQHYRTFVCPLYKEVYGKVSRAVSDSADVRAHVDQILSGETPCKQAWLLRRSLRSWTLSIGKDLVGEKLWSFSFRRRDAEHLMDAIRACESFEDLRREVSSLTVAGHSMGPLFPIIFARAYVYVCAKMRS